MKKVRVRPGKVQSALGMGVGLLFCVIGVLYVIPAFGPFGFLWTIISAAITVVNALNVFTDRGAASSEFIIDVDAKESDPTPEERLEAAKRLLTSGAISESEYEEKRKEILKDV